jgi:hypothetical protein
MTDAWFSPDTARLFSYLSMLSLCSLFTLAARRGRLRGLAIGVWNAVTALGLTLILAGAAAAMVNQPVYVSRALVLSGLLVAVVFAVTRRRLLKEYLDAEVRRTVAADL